MEYPIQELFYKQQQKSIELRSTNCKDRIIKLKLILNWILKNRSLIQNALSKDLGKSAEESDITEIYMVISEIRYAIEHLEIWMHPKIVSAPLTLIGSSSYIYIEPKGVCLIIAPWNYPFSLIACPLISAIAAGNTAILMPSELTPHVAILIEKMISELFDPSEVSVLNGGVDLKTKLLALPFNHIYFTGSTSIGKIVMTAAAQNLASVTLELGGKSPVIVSECANIPDAARKIVWSKFINVGQTCIAPDYILVHEKVKDKLVEALIYQIKRMYDENHLGIHTSKSYGRIVNEKHFDRLIGLLDEAKIKGAKVVFGGNHDRNSKFIEPIILCDLPDCKLLEEEIFGPVLPILTFNKVEDVVFKLNKNPKPLSMYVFSKSKKFSENILLNTSAGGVCINDCLVHYSHPELPFGGVNGSGIGKAHGQFGFEEFSNKKAVLKQQQIFSLTKFLYPPYTNFSKKIINFLIKYF